MPSESCIWGCSRFVNFTLACPGIENTLDVEPYSTFVIGDCVDVCEASFAPGRWWHYTSVTDYFACVDERMSHCDYYEIDRACSPMYSDVIYALQLVSLCCSLLVLVRLGKELKKGLFQLLFISVVHNVCQSIVTEQGYEVWAWYLLPKGQANAMVVMVIHHTHMWFAIAAAWWSLLSAIMLSRHTQGNHCLRLADFLTKHKFALIALMESIFVIMNISAILAQFYRWEGFFEGVTTFCLTTLCFIALFYSYPACKAKHLQRKARNLQRRRATEESKLMEVTMGRPLTSPPVHVPPARGKQRVSMRPFILLLATFLVTYLPYFIIKLVPPKTRTLTMQLISLSFLELVGVFNLIAMTIACVSAKKSASARSKAWLRHDRLVGRGNSSIVGSHAFVRGPGDLWTISAATTAFGTGCAESSVGDNTLCGDFEQSGTGELIRWAKRPNRNPHSLELVGLPLSKFELFVDAQIEEFFPPDILTPLPSGWCYSVAMSSHEEEQREQVAVIAHYEEAVLDWKDAAAMFRGVKGDNTLLSEIEMTAPPNEEQELERAQQSWAYDECTLTLKAAVLALLRWRGLLPRCSSENPRSLEPRPPLDGALLITPGVVAADTPTDTQAPGSPLEESHWVATSPETQWVQAPRQSNPSSMGITPTESLSSSSIDIESSMLSAQEREAAHDRASQTSSSAT